MIDMREGTRSLVCRCVGVVRAQMHHSPLAFGPDWTFMHTDTPSSSRTFDTSPTCLSLAWHNAQIHRVADSIESVSADYISFATAYLVTSLPVVSQNLCRLPQSSMGWPSLPLGPLRRQA